MRILKLTRASTGTPVCINFNNVTIFDPAREGTGSDVFYTGGGYDTVSETPEKIMEMLEGEDV